MKTFAQLRIKKSYSISREAESFVRSLRKARKIASDSEALDQILRESMEANRRGAMDAAYRAFYDAATDEELAQESEWATFSEKEMAELTH